MIAEEGVDQFVKEHYEVIIVDTSGRHRQEAGLLEEMQEISAALHMNSGQCQVEFYVFSRDALPLFAFCRDHLVPKQVHYGAPALSRSWPWR